MVNQQQTGIRSIADYRLARERLGIAAGIEDAVEIILDSLRVARGKLLFQLLDLLVMVKGLIPPTVHTNLMLCFGLLIAPFRARIALFALLVCPLIGVLLPRKHLVQTSRALREKTFATGPLFLEGNNARLELEAVEIKIPIARQGVLQEILKLRHLCSESRVLLVYATVALLLARTPLVARA